MTDTLPENPIIAVTASIHAVEAEATPEQVAHALGIIEGMELALKEAKAMFAAAMRPHLEAHGAMEIGTTRIYLAPTRKVVNTDAPGVLDALFEACEGDMGKACEYLASEPFKQGSVRKLIGNEKWGKCFTVVTGDKVEVTILDTRFID